MLPPYTCRFWQVICLLPPMLPGMAGSTAAQDYRPVANDRAVARVDERVQPTRVTWRESERPAGKSRWDLGLIVSAAYDDNINLSAARPQSDVVIGVVPRVAYAAGDPASSDPASSEPGAYVRFAYLPAGVLYLDNTDLNRVDHDVALAAGWRGRVFAAAYDGSFQRLGDATADTGTPTDRNEYASVARIAWLPREKLAFEAGAGLGGTNYDSRALSDYRERFGELAVHYAYSPKTRLGLAYRVGRVDVDGTGPQDLQRATVRMAWQPRQKISIDLEAGAEWRTFDLGSDTAPVVEARLGWEARQGTGLYLAAFRREEASAFYPGQNYRLGGVTAGLSQLLGNGWTARLEGGWERATYARVSGTGPAGREDRIWFVRPGLDYEVNDRFRVGIFYQVSRDRSNQAGFGYDNHQAGVRMEYQF